MSGDRSQESSARSRYLGLLLMAYWVSLFISTHIPLPPLPLEAEGSDKIMHFVGYGGLGFLLGLWVAVKRRITLPMLLMLLGVLAMYGAADEWLQQFVRRNCDFNDWVADMIGGTGGLSLAAVLQWLRPLRSDSPE